MLVPFDPSVLPRGLTVAEQSLRSPTHSATQLAPVPCDHAVDRAVSLQVTLAVGYLWDACRWR